MAWLVSVNFEAVARRLSRVRTHHVDQLEAMANLSCTWNGIPSPQRQTLRWGWFYTAVDPSLFLDPNEIEVSIVVCHHPRPSKIDPAALGE